MSATLLRANPTVEPIFRQRAAEIVVSLESERLRRVHTEHGPVRDGGPASRHLCKHGSHPSPGPPHSALHSVRW